MRINLSEAYVPQAGDILSWISGKDKILFVVLSNKILSKEMFGVTLFDNRNNGAYGNVHAVSFSGEGFNYRLQLVYKKEGANFSLDIILNEWREEQ